MKRRKNSSKILADSYYKANRRQNHILIIVAAFVIFMIVTVASIIRERIEGDKLKAIQNVGYDVSAFLENGEETQYQQLEEMTYIESIGKIKVFGKWLMNDEGIVECTVLDSTAFEAIYMPAYTEITGEYPESSNEIMVSTRTLKKLGIAEPELGIEIPVTMERNDWMTTGKSRIEDTFTLAGYFTEHSQNTSAAYFSDELLKEHEISMYPLRMGLKATDESVDRKALETRLYQDVGVNPELKQQYIGIETGETQAVRALIGSYGTGIVCMIILLLGIYVMIYNIFLINTNRTIQQYGLLKTIGADNGQLWKIFIWQIMRIVFWGSIIGLLLCLPVIGGILPRIAAKLYTGQAGNENAFSKFHIIIWGLAVLFVSIVMLIAVGRAARKVIRLSPMEAIKYTGFKTYKKKKQIHSKSTRLYKMAWRNVLRFKSQFVVSLLSIVIGCEMILMSVVIVKGADSAHKIMKEPDFEIAVGQAYLLNYPIDSESAEVKEENMMPDTFVDKIREMDGVSNESLQAVYGGFGWCNSEDEAIKPALETKSGTALYTESMFIQVVSDEYLMRLSEYVEGKNLDINMEELKNGRGTVLLHEHSFSEQETEKLGTVINKPVHFSKIETVARENEGDWEQELICCGYMDITEDNFPMPDMPVSAKDINYFIVSEKAFSSLNLTEQTFKIGFDVDGKREEDIKDELKRIIRDVNESAGTYSVTNRAAVDRTEYRDLYYLTAKSDILAEQQEYLESSRMIMLMLSTILGLMGLISYTNSVTSGILARRKEFAIMQSIGMTEKQLKTMLIWESAFSAGCALLVAVTFGTVGILVLGRVLQEQIPYFRMYYPIKELILIGLCLFAVCIVIPQLELSRTSKYSDVYRLNHES